MANNIEQDIKAYEEQFKLVVNNLYNEVINDICNDQQLISDPSVQEALQRNEFVVAYNIIKLILAGYIEERSDPYNKIIIYKLYHRVRIYLSTVADRTMNSYINNYFSIPECNGYE